MKPFLSNVIIPVIIINMVVLQSCHSNNNPYQYSAKDTTTVNVDTSKIKIDTTNKMMDRNAQNTNDARIMINLAAMNYEEIEVLKLALTKSIPGSLKMDVQKMITDHQNAVDSLKKIAGVKNIVLPEESGVKNPDVYNKLNAENGKDFEKNFLAWVIATHKDALNIFTEYGKKAFNTDINAWINAANPIVQSHLQMMQAVQAKFDSTNRK